MTAAEPSTINNTKNPIALACNKPCKRVVSLPLYLYFFLADLENALSTIP